MGFLAPIASAVVPLLSKVFGNKGVQNAAAGIGSSILGSKLGGGQGGVANTQGLIDEQQAGIRQTRNTATGLQPTANDLLRQSSAAYSPVISHYNALLSGNRGAAMSELSPEVQRINQGYDQASRNSSALMPRGGGRTAFNSELPYEHMRDVNNLLSTSRSTGAQGLLQAGSAAGGQGQGLYSSILSGLAGASAGGNSLLNYDLQAKAEQSKKNQELGQQIYGILGPLLGKIGANKSSGPSPNTDMGHG